MKKQKITTMTKMIMLAALVFVFASCSDGEDGNPETISSDEAAEIVASSVAEDSEGMTEQIEDTAEDAEELLFDESSCNTDSTASFSLTNPQAAIISYDFAYTYSYSLTCNGFQEPSAFDFSFTQSGDVDAPRYVSNTNSSGGWTLEGLESSSVEYTLNGNYERTGTHTSRVLQQNTYDFTLDIELSDVIVDKSDYRVQDGAGTFTMTGTSSSGSNFSIDGSIEYLDNNQVRIIISGQAYIVDSESGDIIE